MLSKNLDSHLHITGASVNDELLRLASYLNWPSSAPVRPSALSRNGFTYEGQGLITRCVACGIVVDSWTTGDRPQDIHRNKSPTCPFVVAETSSISRDVDNIASSLQQMRVNEPSRRIVRSDGETLTSAMLPSSAGEPSTSAVQQPGTTAVSAMPVDRSRPDFVQLRSESVRLSTFHDWPSSAGRIVEPCHLAAAGLFYTGHADRVQCAFCRGLLRSWRPGDIPAKEHRRHFPECPLVRADASASIPCDSSTIVVSFPFFLCTI